MKVLSVCICVAFLIGTSFLVSTDANNIIWGSLEPGDFLVYYETVVINASYNEVVSKNVFYPPRDYMPKHNLSYIGAADYNSKDGGTATLIRGGPGHRQATVALKSDLSHGLNYTVAFYGH